MAAGDDPFSQLSPAERAYLLGGDKQQGTPTVAAPAGAPASIPPTTTTGAPQDGPLSGLFATDPSGGYHAIETGIRGGMQTVLNAPSDWLRRAGFNVGDLAGPNAPIIVPALTPAEQAGQQAHPMYSGAGRFAGEALMAAPAAIAGEAVLPAMEGAAAFAPIIRGAIMGAGQNALTSAGSPDQSIGSQMLTGAGFGAAGGWLGGRIGRMFGSDATLASKSVQDAGNTVKAAGIDVLPGNLPQAGATAAQKGAAANPVQAQQINNAFSKIVGGDVNDFSAANLGPLTNKVGGEISTAVNQGQVQMTPALESELQAVLQKAHAPGIDPLVTAKIEAEVDKVLSIAPKMGDTVAGSQFDRLVGAGSKLSKYTGDANQDLSGLARELDTTLDRGFQASSKAGVYDQYVDAKTRYRMLKAIEDNVEGDAAGNIKPGSIMSDINRRFPDMPTQTGAGTVGKASDLARAVTTVFGGSGGAPGAAAAGGGFISRHPLLSMLGAGAAGGGGPAIYNALTNPAALGAASTWAAAHIPVVAPLAAAALAQQALRRGGAYYQQSGRFANTLLQRGTQQTANPLAAYSGAAAAALPPDRKNNR